MTKQEMAEARGIQLAKIEGVTVKYRGVYEKAYTGKVRPAAVKAKCLDCQQNNRASVRDCETIACPLWQYRPYRSAEQKAEGLAIGASSSSVKPAAPKPAAPAAPAGGSSKLLALRRKA